MLVLTRKVGEKIRIGDDITIVVLEGTYSTQGYSGVRIGIDAPRDVPVYREEVYQERKNREANSVGKTKENE